MSLSDCSSVRSDIYVTGLGVVSPLGGGLGPSFERLIRGESAIQKMTLESGTNALGAPTAFTNSEGEPVIGMTLKASEEALHHAGIDLNNFDRSRIGCVIGTSKAGLRSFGLLFARLREEGGELSELTELWEQSQLSSPATALSRHFGLRGPLLTPVAACATGMLAVQRGARLIEEGTCDVVIAGSVDASLLEMVVASYRKLGILSKSRDPSSACRPFDQNRDGFVIGEGAGILILQSESSLTSGQRPLARYLGGVNLSTGSDLTSLSEASADYVELLKRTLSQTSRTPDQIALVSLHGTATRDNDLLEMQAVSRVLGAKTPSVGFKGALGHLLGAAGSVELVYALQALITGRSPMTVGCEHVDQSYDVDIIRSEPRDLSSGALLKVSAGFGGHLATGRFERV